MIFPESSDCGTISETPHPYSISHTLHSRTFHGNYLILHRCTTLPPHRRALRICRQLDRKNAKETFSLVLHYDIHNMELGCHNISPCVGLESTYETDRLTCKSLLIFTKSESENLEFPRIIPADMLS